MTYTYNTGIPAANNDPSVDQPDMLINTQSINDLIGVNHITFNASNGGQHKAIVFNQDASYVPVPPVSPPQLFTDIISGLPQLKYYSGNAAQSSTQYVSAANGSTFLLGGIILKWGTTGAIASGAVVPFTSSFPNNCYCVVANSTATNTTIFVTTLLTSSFRAFFSGVNTTINYIAIGN